MTLCLFLVIILLALLIIFIGRRSNLSDKNKERLKKLEDELFYNPIIRATLLSGIKVNITAMLVF